MARPEKNRKICQPPLMKGFKPFGIKSCKDEHVRLRFEEYESLRLVSYEMLSQKQASEMMHISRPTLTRIYNKAIKIITKAFIEGRVIKIEGGNYEFDRDWFRCRKCHKLIQGLANHIRCNNCSEYEVSELIHLNS